MCAKDANKNIITYMYINMQVLLEIACNMQHLQHKPHTKMSTDKNNIKFGPHYYPMM